MSRLRSISFAFAVLALTALAAGCGGKSSADSSGGSSGNAGSAGTGGNAGVGGGAQGGSAGSSAGAGGGAGSSGTGGGSAGSSGVIGECKSDADCEIVSTCCDCLAGKKGTVEAPPCAGAVCQVDACGTLGVSEARCIAGQCSIAANCDLSQVPCKSFPPTCPPGQKPTAGVNGCWGPCVPAQACAEVKDCLECPAGTICVVNDAWTSSHHCVNPSPSCSGGCECLEALVCIGGHTLCGEFDDGSAAHCACPSC